MKEMRDKKCYKTCIKQTNLKNGKSNSFTIIISLNVKCVKLTNPKIWIGRKDKNTRHCSTICLYIVYIFDGRICIG
jgi:hypothetical protein